MKQVSFVRTNEKVSSKMETGEEELFYTNPLSLDSRLIDNPTATYFVEVGTEDSITFDENPFLGVKNGDVLVIDRSLRPTPGRLVLSVLDGVFTLSRFVEHEGRRYLVYGESSETNKECNDGVHIWGVVSALGRRL